MSNQSCFLEEHMEHSSYMTDVSHHIHHGTQAQPQIETIQQQQDLMHLNAAIRSMSAEHTLKRSRCHFGEECHLHPSKEYCYDTSNDTSRPSSNSRFRRRRNRPFTLSQYQNRHHLNPRIVIALLVSLQLCTAGTVSALSLSVFSSPSHTTTTSSSTSTSTSSSQLQMNCMNTSMNHNNSSYRSSGASSTTGAGQFHYYNHYNHDLLNRIISGRKSVHPKWRRKARRAATLLGIPRNCNLDTDEEQDKESSSYSMDANSVNEARTSDCSSIMTPYIENMKTMKEWNGVVTMDCQNPTSVSSNKPNSSMSSSLPLLYKDGNVWKVSRGGGNHKDESKKNRRQKKEQQTDFHIQPVPPASSTILRSIEACNVDNDHDNNDDIATKNIINDKEHMHSKAKPFKRRKLQILKYSQHRRQQDQQQPEDENDAWDTNEETNNDCMKQLSPSLSSNHNNNSIITNKKKPLSLSKLFSKGNHNHNPNLTTTMTPKKRNYNSLSEEEKAYAKSQWAAKYTSLSTLRQTFGRNRNKFWGDFDSNTTRRLYHTLLPRALLELYDIGLWSPNELAPLAYEARKAAKKYARERCVVPGRVMAMFFDGFRMWRDWGTWSVEGMSWEQIWNKYETQILEEMMEDCREDGGDYKDRYDFLMSGAMDGDSDECLIDLNESNVQEEITAQICLRILERSCGTNPLVDQLFLRKDDDNDSSHLQAGDGDMVDETSISGKNTITDTNRNFLHGNNNTNAKTTSQKRRRRRKRNAERDLARIRNRLEMDMQDLLQLNRHNDGQ